MRHPLYGSGKDRARIGLDREKPAAVRQDKNIQVHVRGRWRHVHSDRSRAVRVDRVSAGCGIARYNGAADAKRRQPIERDPHYGPALALAAHCHQGLEVNGWAEDPEATRHTSVDFARQALRSAPDDPNVLALTAFVLGYFGEDIDVSLALIDRCLALNPSHARGWHWSALLRIFAGQPELALEQFATYLRLSPRDRMATYLNGIGEAYFFSRRFDEAAANLLASLDLVPSFPVTYCVLASCYAHIGLLNEAREIVRRLRVITPAVMEPGTRYQNPELRELFLSGLRLAAGQET